MLHQTIGSTFDVPSSILTAGRSITPRNGGKLPYRVIQWATGVVGRYALRSILERPDLELVGVVVHNPEKAGIDAGELAGLEPTGILATDDPQAILGVDADCVSYMAAPSAFFGPDPDLDADRLCSILESGKNVVTTSGFLYPAAQGNDLLARLQQACERGGTTLHGTGVNPGFIGDLLPLVVSGLSARIDGIYARESSDMTRYASQGVIVDSMGFTKAPGEYDAGVDAFRRFMYSCFVESIHLIAEGLGVVVDEVRAHDEHLLADERLVIAAGVVEPGTVCASRWEYTGIVGGRPLITLEAAYAVHPDRVRAWHRPGMVVRVDGQPTISIDLGEEWNRNMLLSTAAHAVNAIPAVCDAPAGVRSVLDLPLLTGRGTVSSTG